MAVYVGVSGYPPGLRAAGNGVHGVPGTQRTVERRYRGEVELLFLRGWIPEPGPRPASTLARPFGCFGQQDQDHGPSGACLAAVSTAVGGLQVSPVVPA